MEDSKLLALHESLSKLRKSAGLGVSSRYSWQKADTNESNFTTAEDGTTIRKDGLPVNPLYNNFVKEGSYDPTKLDHGDGRAIKRDFSDSAALISDSGNSTSDGDDASLDSDARRKKKKLRKEKRKEDKKAAKKAAKLEAKRQAKLEEKKRMKKEAKRKLREAQASLTEEECHPKKKSKKSVDKISIPDASEKAEKKSKQDKKEKKSKKEKKGKRWISCRNL